MATANFTVTTDWKFKADFNRSAYPRVCTMYSVLNTFTEKCNARFKALSDDLIAFWKRWNFDTSVVWSMYIYEYASGYDMRYIVHATNRIRVRVSIGDILEAHLHIILRKHMH